MEVTHGARCDECGICSDYGGNVAPVPPAGPKGARVILLGEAPGKSEVRKGIPFIGDSGSLLNALLKKVGIQRDDCWVSNALLCRPPANRDPVKSELEACGGRLQIELSNLPNRHVIIALGTSALKALWGDDTSTVTYEQYNVRWSDNWGAFIVPCYHPAAVLRSDGYFNDFMWALDKAAQMLDVPKGKPSFPQIQTEVIWNSKDQLDFLRDMANVKSPLKVAADLETDGLHPYRGHFQDWAEVQEGDPCHIISHAFSGSGKRAVVLPLRTGPLAVSDPRDVLMDADLQKALSRMYANPAIQWIWHNGVFDTMWLQHFDIAGRIDIDTLLKSYTCDERQLGHGLADVAARHLGTPNWKDELKEWVHITKDKKKPYSHVPREILFQYQGRDVAYSWLANEKMDQILEEEARTEPSKMWPGKSPIDCHDEILVPVANAYSRCQLNGVFVDLPYLKEKDREFQEELFAKEIEILGMVLDRFPTFQGATKSSREDFVRLGKWLERNDVSPMRATDPKWWDEAVEGIAGDKRLKARSRAELVGMVFNIRSNTQVAWWIYDVERLPKGRDGRTTKAEVLEKLEKDSEFVRKLQAYRTRHKLWSTYIQGILKEHTPDGRVLIDVKLHAARTGRVGMKKPSLVTIPRDDVVKRAFIPAPGCVWMHSDYAQAEVRKAALFSDDEALLQAARGDLHTAVSREVFSAQYALLDQCSDLDDVEHVLITQGIFRALRASHIAGSEEQLYSAEKKKAPTYWEHLQTKARKHLRFCSKSIVFGVMYGQTAKGLSEGELQCEVRVAQGFIDRFFQRFPQLHKYLKSLKKQALTDQYIDTPSGRRRRFPFVSLDAKQKAEIRRAAGNMPIQAAANDMNFRAFVILEREIRENGWGRALFTVHDSIEAEILEEFVDVAKARTVEVMEGIASNDKVHFKADVGTGDSWASANAA